MDKELRRSLDEISEKLDKLANGGDSNAKQKAATWKRVTIGIPIAVAFIGLIGTAYELSLKFIESHNNRETIRYYTSLAKSFAENEADTSAQSYLARATEIDPNNADVVATTAFVDILTLLRRRGVDELLQGTYDLSALRLNPEEIYYHIGKTAVEEGKLDVAEDYLGRIKRARTRLSVLARSKLIGEVYPRTLNLKETHVGLADATKELSRFAEDVHEFDEDPDLARSFRNHMYSFGYAVMFRLPENELASLQSIFSKLDPPDEEFLGALGGQLEALKQDSAASIESEDKILQSLLAAQEKSRQDSSFFASQVDDAIAQYTVQLELKASEPQATDDLTDLEAERSKGMQKRRSSEYREADTILLDIIQRYKQQNLPADNTLYKTYFDLARLYEYDLHRIKPAIEFYGEAEKLAVDLKLNDPTVFNTLGYFYYKLGRDLSEPEYLNLARDKLNAALAIKPNDVRTLKTLDLVEMDFKRLERTRANRKKLRQQPIRFTAKKQL